MPNRSLHRMRRRRIGELSVRPINALALMRMKPTTKDLQKSIRVICKVIGQIPCFYLYEEHVACRFSTSDAEISLRAMTHNAALDSTLISLRCFNEFFSADRHKDDIRASDFPGVTMQPFLQAKEATAIHKYLAHITATRSGILTKPWFVDSMVLLSLQHGIAFLSAIEATFPPTTEAGRAELRGVRDAARLLIPKITNR